MKRIGIVTNKDWPDGTPSDRLFFPFLREAGFIVEPVIWRKKSVDWSQFDALIIRSTWDYYIHREQFSAWLDLLDEQKIPVFNSTGVIRWNQEKGYLRELEILGAEIPQSIWLKKGTTADLNQIMEQHQLDEIVLKPTVSATAYETWRIRADEVEIYQPKLEDLLSEHHLIIQPFLSEIVSDGEWSLIFFNKQFSHAVVKKAKAGDFRVQNEFDGTFEAVVPPEEMIQKGKQIISWLPDPLLYARVDGIWSEGRFVLMEVELIEPELYLETDEGSAGRFAEAIEDIFLKVDKIRTLY